MRAQRERGGRHGRAALRLIAAAPPSQAGWQAALPRPRSLEPATVSAKFAMTGSVLVPEATLDVQAKRVTANGLPPLDAHLAVTGGRDDIRAQLTTLRHRATRPRRWRELSAMLDAPLGAIQDQDVIGRVPFDLKARLHPTALKELAGLSQADPRAARAGAAGHPLRWSWPRAARWPTPQVVLDAGRPAARRGQARAGPGPRPLHLRGCALRLWTRPSPRPREARCWSAPPSRWTCPCPRCSRGWT